METEQVKVAAAEAPKTEETIKESPKEAPKEQTNFSPEYLDKKIDELVEQRLKAREEESKQRIADAQRIIDEANERAALEQRIQDNEKYSATSNWRKHKEEEFKAAIAKLGEMGRRKMHMSNMYENYELYKSRAVRGDQRAIDMLGRIQLIDACMRYSPDELLKIYKRNIGVIDW